jgi:ketosteroid isomerase-like protein
MSPRARGSVLIWASIGVCCVALASGCVTTAGKSGDVPSVAKRYTQTAEAVVDPSDVDKYAPLYAEDAVFEDVPMEERVEGRSNILDHFRTNMSTDETTDTVEYIVTGDDWFVVQDRVTSGQGEFGSNVTFFTMFEVDDGLITHQLEFYPSDAPWLEYYR